MDINNLSKKELLLLKAKIDLKLKSFEDGNDQLFYDCIISELRKEVGGWYPVRLSMLKKNKKTPTLVNNIKELADNLETMLMNVEPDYDVHLLARFYILYVKIVMDRVRELELPLTITCIVNLGNEFPSLLNKAYPGYLKYGWIRMILNGE